MIFKEFFSYMQSEIWDSIHAPNAYCGLHILT